MPSFVHQRHEQAIVGRVVLWVPLDSQGEGGPKDLDSLHRAVIGETDRFQLFAEAVHRLVVMTMALCPRPEYGAGPAALF